MLIVNSSANVLSCNASQLVLPAATIGSLTVGSVLIGYLDTISQVGPSPCTMIMRLVIATIPDSSQTIVQTVPAALEDVFVTVNVTVSDITEDSLHPGFYNSTEATMLSNVVNVSGAPRHDLNSVADVALLDNKMPESEYKIGVQLGGFSLTTSQGTLNIARASLLPITVGAYLLRNANDPSVSAGLTVSISVDVGYVATFKKIQGNIPLRTIVERTFKEWFFFILDVPFSIDFGAKVAYKLSVEGEFDEGLTLGAELTGLPTITVGVACGSNGGCQPVGSGNPNFHPQPSFSSGGFCTYTVSIGVVESLEVSFNLGSKRAYELLDGFFKSIGRDFRSGVGEILKAEISLSETVEAVAKAPDSKCGCVNNKEQASETVTGKTELEAEVSLGGRYVTVGSASYKIPGPEIELPKLCSQDTGLLQCVLHICGSTSPPPTEVTFNMRVHKALLMAWMCISTAVC